MKFTIDRSIWRCGGDSHYYKNGKGHGRGLTELLNSQGYMCCLGQVCHQAGVPKAKLLHAAYPTSVKLNEYNELISFLRAPWVDTGYYKNSELGQDAVDINDSTRLTLEEKEVELTKVFAEHGHEIVFTGEYNEVCN